VAGVIPSWPPAASDVDRLLETLALVDAHSPHYRARFAAADVRVADLRGYDDFRRRVPRTTKAEVVATQREHPPFGDFLAAFPSELAAVHVSPGPLYIPRLADEPAGTPVLMEAIAAMGVRPGEVAHVTLSYHIMPGGLRLHRAFEQYGCIVLNGGTGASALQLQVARDLGASVYAGTPSFLGRLADQARELGWDPRRDLHYRLGFSTAEALPPALRAELETTFGIELYDHCGEALIGPVAGECRAHAGMHLHAHDLFLEFLDVETGEPVAPGETGELVATHLGRRALPLVRYAPGDVYRLREGACPCGNPAPRVDFVGQTGTIRKVRGVLVHAAQIAAVLREFPELGRFQLEIEHPRGERYERATLRAGLVSEAPADLATRVSRRLKESVLVDIPVRLVPDAELPEGAGPPRWAGAIVDRRH
jgi:phenylacetate-CoA ligase